MRLHTVALAFTIALAAPLSSAAQPADPLWSKVDAVLGAAGKDLPGGVHRFGWPRRDLHVRMGEVAVEPAFATVQQVLGRKGTLAGTVLQLGVPRAERIEEHGMEIPASMGMANALNFQRVGNPGAQGAQVATTGDFVLIATEVNPVIRE